MLQAVPGLRFTGLAAGLVVIASVYCLAHGLVIDDEINTTGSMNHTTSGNRYNDERLDVITDVHLTARAREKFLSMWNDSVRYEDWK